MPSLLKEDNWQPVGVDDLEGQAHLVVRSSENKLVIAGPGAGKTELLAQRANFLLATGRCSNSKRILAISFKRDAAKNLSERVRARSGDYCDRFDSMTLDSFAKQLVDRFYPALPSDWRPRPNYLVRTSFVSETDARVWFDRANIPIGHNRPEMGTKSKGKVLETLDKVMHGTELPYEAAHAVLQTWGIQWWKEQLALPVTEPSLSFPMLNRLAAYLLRTNPKITVALRCTYSHVFLDEFQDTTASQWDLISSAFAGSDSVLTAVGDSKQRIMVWAGADADIFEKFKTTFEAEQVSLIRNYRSVPELLRIQHAIAQVVDVGSAEPEAATSHEGDGVCSILEFENPEAEAAYLADFIFREIEGGGNARDFCVLARQGTGAMVALLQDALREKGISLRDESLLQDLRAEPVTHIVMMALRLATSTRDPNAWGDLASQLSLLAGLDDESDSAELERLNIAHKNCVQEFLRSGTDIKNLPSLIVALVGIERYRTCYRQYMNGRYLEKLIEDLGNALAFSLESAGSIEKLVADFNGEDIVPAMSIHKSKGLEFKTVIFMGLEDEQWWNFRAQPEEEKRAFFVAFSRAISSVLFTYSKERPKWGRLIKTNYEQVGALFEILQKAGVEVKTP